jgi:upstream activation factor subunit UAF30
MNTINRPMIGEIGIISTSGGFMAKKAKKKSKRKPSAAFMAPLHPSAALAAVVGSKALPRTQAVKKLWAYIKKKKLQDKKNKRQINPDAALAKVFGTSRPVNMFAMMKHLKKHLKK